MADRFTEGELEKAVDAWRTMVERCESVAKELHLCADLSTALPDHWRKGFRCWADQLSPVREGAERPEPREEGDAPVADLERLVAELRRELEDEWAYNHSEHCESRWPHEGRCGWPRPPVLDDEALQGIERLPDHEEPPYLRRRG